MYKVIIIDDEEAARDKIRRLISPHSNDFTVLDEAANGTDAIKKINLWKPDVIFLDIRMPRPNGLELLDQLEVPPIVIFTTAFAEYSLAAFRKNSISFLLKPIKQEDFDEAIQKLKVLAPAPEVVKAILKKMQDQKNSPYLRIITCKIGNIINRIAVEDVTCFLSRDKYTNILCNGKVYPVDTPLHKFVAELNPELFIQVRRGAIVNFKAIRTLKRNPEKSKYELVMENETVITVSRTYADKVLNRYKQLAV